MGIPNKYVIVAVVLAAAVVVALRSKIPPCYLSDEQFLTFLPFLETVNWVGYFEIPPEKRAFLMARQ